VTRIFTRALLLAAVVSSAVMAGCAWMDGKKETTASQPAAAHHQPATSQPAASQSAASTEPTAGESVDDAVVTAKVKAKLIDDEVTKAYQINVETFKGTVQLSGSVDSAEARSRATELARDVGGVKDVKNSLQVGKPDG
jgi:osmotically-inducible protein OsmY